VKPTRVLNCAGLVRCLWLWMPCAPGGVPVVPLQRPSAAASLASGRAPFFSGRWVPVPSLVVPWLPATCSWLRSVCLPHVNVSLLMLLLLQTGRPNVDWCEDHKEEVLRCVLCSLVVSVAYFAARTLPPASSRRLSLVDWLLSPVFAESMLLVP
jgi:hypothetical protein